MSILKFFRRRSPRHRADTRPSVAEALTMSAWNLTEDQWHSLSDFERAECRRLVTTAPRFQP